MNIAVAQSGGPTCAINASLAGVVRQSFEDKTIETVFGSRNGIEGMINDNLVKLNDVIKSETDFELLIRTPSSALGSCRYKLPDFRDDETSYLKIEECLKKHCISAFFYIGGNDSMDTVAKLDEYFSKKGGDFKFIGIPKTIDNDLVATDHTPGFGSAAKYVLATTNEIIRDTSVYDLKSVMIIEIMGRHAGWLTASTVALRANGINKPQLIYLPECDFNVDNFVEDVKNELAKENIVVIAVSEGIELGEETVALSTTDGFGHKNLGGVGKQLENIVKDRIGCKVRSVELNVLQRCASHFASKTDLEEAENVGRQAVKKAVEGQTGIMITMERVNGSTYEVKYSSTPAKNVANDEKPFCREWINDRQNNVLDDAIDYFLPLIEGEVTMITENGIPLHFEI